MLSKQGLEVRLSQLKSDLTRLENKFHDIRDELKLAKKQITDTRGAISEVERLLQSSDD